MFSLKDAFKLPCLVIYNCRLKGLDGKIVLESPIRKHSFIFGFGRVSIFDEKTDRAVLDIRGTLVLRNEANFGAGSKLSIGKKATLTIGKWFTNTAKGTIVCADNITIGDKVLASWDTLIMDTDFHACINTLTGKKGPVKAPVTIGDNVWIGARSTILKGTAIANGCIIGASSLVNKSFEKENSLIAGNPARIVKENITRAI